MSRDTSIILLSICLIALVLVELAFFGLPQAAGISAFQKAAKDRPLAIENGTRAAAVFVDPIPLVIEAKKMATDEIVIKGERFTVEVARTESEHQKGLSGHAPLGTDEGMFFVFDAPGRYGFWMKDMAFPIDIIWLDGKSRITHIVSNAQLSSYPTVFTSDVPSLYVLEVTAGTAERLDLRIGDNAVLP